MKTKNLKTEDVLIPRKKFILGIEQALKVELDNILSQIPKGIVDEPIQTGGDEIDVSTQLFDRHLSMSMKERNQKRVREITFALNRLKLPDFGVCEDCEHEIEQKRIIHVPTARFCIQCQVAFERRSKVIVSND